MQYLWIGNAEDFIKVNVTVLFFLRLSDKVLYPLHIFLAIVLQSQQISYLRTIIEYVREIIRWFKFN